MDNSINTLKASLLTLKEIKKRGNDPLETLQIFMSGGRCSREKLIALFSRSDVVGIKAHKILKLSSESPKYFEVILELYIDKFINKKNRDDGLCYAIMTAQLWIRLSTRSEMEISEDLGQISKVFIALIERWPEYQKSSSIFFDDVEKFFESYNVNSSFPDDHSSELQIFDGTNISKQMKTEVFPFIGRIMIRLFQSNKYFQSSEDLWQFATRKYFANKQKAGPLYLKSVECTFSLNDIESFISEPGDAMEQFLLSAEGEVARLRFGKLCQKSPAATLLSLMKFHPEYGGFKFSENKYYQKLSLSKKIDILRPQPHKADSPRMVKMWVNDPEWVNPKRSLSELTLLAIQKSTLFPDISQGRESLYELMEVILIRKFEITEFNDVWKNEVIERINKNTFNSSDFEKLISNNHYLFSVSRILRSSISSNNQQKPFNLEWSNKRCLERIKELFFAHVVECLPSYRTTDACRIVEWIHPENNEAILDHLVSRELNFSQTIGLLNSISLEHHNWPASEILMKKLVNFITRTKSDYNCLRRAIYALARYEHRSGSKALIAIAFRRLSYRNIIWLLDDLYELTNCDNISCENFKPVFISDSVKNTLQVKLQNRIFANGEKSIEEALGEAKVYLNHQISFVNRLNKYYWYYSNFNLNNIDEVWAHNLKPAEIIRLFANEPQRQAFVEAWRKMPFDSDCIRIGLNHKITLSNHPSWLTFGLQERINLFNLEDDYSYENLKESFTVDLMKLWKSEKWTVKKFIDAISMIDKTHAEFLARKVLEALAI
ncbi:MAG: hypothetical protein ACOYMB_02185 [Patescibacteria group bacterium]